MTLHRRSFLTASAAGLAAASLGACTYENSAYAAVLGEMTQPVPVKPEIRDLVRYATLAGNGHNTQPWQFRAHRGHIVVLPDLARRTPVVDPDDHHLYASLGCAAENLGVAARARGMAGAVRFTAAGQGRVSLETAPRDESSLFAAIPKRQCSRVIYDRRPVTTHVVRKLADAASSYGVEAIFITDVKRIEAVLELVIEGNSTQIDDPAFVEELRDWIRFNPDDAAATRDGLYAASSGNPTMPSWLGRRLFGVFFDKETENDKYAKQARSSAGVVVFVAATDDRKGWFGAGRAYQRFALQATADGLKHAFLNQAVEVPAVRRALQSLLGIGDRRPNLVVRYGYGPVMPKSLRRSVDAVIV